MVVCAGACPTPPAALHRPPNASSRSWTSWPTIRMTASAVSELARRLGLSKPTCLGIVTTLADAGYLVRDGADKTYRLGPSLITLGHTAQESMRVSPAAREELRRLSATFGITAALSAVIDDRITLLDLVGPAGAQTRGRGRPELSVRAAGRADVRAVGRRGAARLAGQGAHDPAAHATPTRLRPRHRRDAAPTAISSNA